MNSTLDPELFRLELALSEFSKARWAAEPKARWAAERYVDAYLEPTDLEPTDLDLVANRPVSPRKRASLRPLLIAFCGGIFATLVWQSYGGGARKMIASSPLQPHSSSPQAAPEAATRAIEAGGFVVQLSAARSEPQAQAAFRTMQAKYSVLSGLDPLIRRKDQGERGVFYVAQVGPFGVKSEADQLCETLKSEGRTCFVQRN